MESLLQDLRFALRMLRKSPGFTTVAVITLALGLGANTAIFSVVNSLLVRPYPFPRLDELVVLRIATKGPGPEHTLLSAADLRDLTADRSLFQDVAWFGFHDYNLGRPGDMESASGYAVTPNLFAMVGARPVLGRLFQADESEPGRDQVAVLSYGFWQRRFGGDPKIVGSNVQIDGRECTVIGIMPPKFNYPLGSEVWTPLALSPAQGQERGTMSLFGLGRLRSGLSLAAAQARVSQDGRQLQQQFPATNAGRDFTLLRLREEQYRYTLPLFLLLQAAAAFVLLLACVNVANLVLIRVIGRQRELAVRTALGASRGRVLRFFLCESMLLSVVGGGAAAAAALWGVDAIRVSLPPGYTMWLAGWDTIAVDVRVMALTVGCVLALAGVFGLAMAARAGHIDVNRTLKEGGGTATSRGQNRLRAALVVVQMVLAMVLLVGAGVMVRGFLHLQDMFAAIGPEHVARYTVRLPESRFPTDLASRAFYDRLLARLQQVPGAGEAALITNPPASNVDSPTTVYTLPERPALRTAELPSADLQIVSPQTLSLLQVTMLEGRPLTAQDGPDAPPVAVISRHMAQTAWPGGSPIGHKLRLGGLNAQGPEITVVGVAGDVQLNWFDPVPHDVIYRPYAQAPRRSGAVMVRTSGDAGLLIAGIRRAMWEVDPTVAISGLRPMPLEISESLGPLRVIGALMLVFGAIALLLSTIGLYGVVAHSVAGRGQEFSIRLAVGAQRSDLLRLVLREGVRLTAIGLAAGVVLSVIAVRVLASQMYGVVALSPGMLVQLMAVLFVSALAAAYIPARRAARSEPLGALRQS